MNNYQAAKLSKRLLAIFYDVLIVFLITVVLTILIQQIVINLELVPLKILKDSAGEIAVIPPDSILSIILKSLWTLISFFYFGYYWTKRGQTLGMKVWKIKAVSTTSQNFSWLQAVRRYVFALLGLGLIWILFDKERLALQDRLSQSKLIQTND